MFLIFVSSLCVPEGDGRVLSVWLGVGVHHRVGEVGPLVVRPDVGKVDEGVDGECNAQGTALPGARCGMADVRCPIELPCACGCLPDICFPGTFNVLRCSP